MLERLIYGVIFLKKIIIYTDIKKEPYEGNSAELPKNCIVKPIYLKSGNGFTTNVIRMFQLPIAFIHIYFILRNSKYIHLRSPGITTLIVNIFNKIINKPTIVKWATVFGKMKISSKIIPVEYFLLKSPPSNTKVLIYGEPKHKNHVSSFPAMMSRNEVSFFIKKRTIIEMGVSFQTLVYCKIN